MAEQRFASDPNSVPRLDQTPGAFTRFIPPRPAEPIVITLDSPVPQLSNNDLPGPSRIPALISAPPPVPTPGLLPQLSRPSPEILNFLNSLPAETHNLVYTALKCAPPASQAAPPIAPIPISYSGPVVSLPSATLAHMKHLVDFAHKLEQFLAKVEGIIFSPSELKLLQDVARLPKPTCFTVPVCQEIINFANTFHGNVKVTLDAKYKSSKFKFAFFQQLALYYCMKDYHEGERPLNQPADEVILNMMSYTDRMDIITTSVVSVFHTLFENQIANLTRQRDEYQRGMRSFQEKLRNITAGIGYIFPAVDPALLEPEIQIMEVDTTVTIYKVTHIGHCNVALKNGDVKQEDISQALSAVKKSSKNEGSTVSTQLSLSGEDLTVHHPKAWKIPLLKLLCLFVDGTDRNVFCIGYVLPKGDMLKVVVLCTNTQSASAEIVTSIHRCVTLKRPENSRPIETYQT